MGCIPCQIKSLQNAGFESMHEYIEGYSHYDASWSYLVSFKNYKSRARWYRNSAEIEIELRQRIHATKSGQSALRFFDGPTMISYQLPSKVQEVVFCRKEETPWECKLGFDQDLIKDPTYQFETQTSGIEEYDTVTHQTARDVPKRYNIKMSDGSKAFHILPSTWSLIDAMYGYGSAQYKISSVSAFAEGM